MSKPTPIILMYKSFQTARSFLQGLAYSEVYQTKFTSYSPQMYKSSAQLYLPKNRKVSLHCCIKFPDEARRGQCSYWFIHQYGSPSFRGLHLDSTSALMCKYLLFGVLHQSYLVPLLVYYLGTTCMKCNTMLQYSIKAITDITSQQQLLLLNIEVP